ncbi:MAG: DUF4258 domain-containing protein [Lachnospiraceae bacterium]|nr:DUF4258 domain-containing protein [Lachnospiraceae bacterium]
MNIEQIRKAFVSGVSVEYRAHCLKRMLERDILRKDIENCIMKGEIIEDYPLDEFNISTESYPSCLILGYTVIEQKALHVVVGYKETTIIIITAYEPNAERWMPDNKTRRK